MKHLFLLHSTITDLVARRVIEHEAVDPNDAVLMTSRGFTSLLPTSRQVPIAYSHNPESFPKQWNVRDAWRRLGALDRRIRDCTGGDRYHFYTPQTGQRFMQLLKSHRRCTGFSFIEEGLGSYMTHEAADRLNAPQPATWQDRIAYRGRIGTMRFYDDGHARAYGVEERSFPGFSGRVVLPHVFDDCACDVQGDVECVFVVSGSARYDFYTLDGELAGLARALDVLADRGISRIHYKLHPVLVDWPPAARYGEFFAQHADRFEFIELDQDFQLEGVAARFPDATFLVNLSSLAVYASQAGCTVLSYATYVAEAEAAFAPMVANLPAIFVDSVTMLGAQT